MRPFTFWASTLALLLPVGAFADSSSVVVRVGSHDGYGRIAFALPPRTDYQLTQQDQHVVIQFSGDLKIGPANAIPRNVVAIKGGERQATLDLARGTVVHDWRYGDRLVVDVRDPGTQLTASSGQAPIAKNPDAAKANGQSTQPDSARPQPAQPDTGKPAASKPETPTPTTPKLAPAASTSDGVPASAPPASAIAPDHEQLATASNPGAPGPPQAAIQPVPPQSDVAPAAPSQASASNEKAQPEAASDNTSDGVLDIPAGPQLGLAVFRLSKVAMIVLDQQRTVDVAPLRDDPVFSSAVVQMLPTATVIRVPVDPGVTFASSRVGGMWRIAAATPELPLRPIQAVVADDRLLLQAAAPGAVVSIVDPDTGTTVLVGTQRSSGQGVPVRRRTPEFTLLSSW